MNPKFWYSAESEVPAEYKALYHAKDGRWELKVEGAVAAERLVEFRNNNVELTKQLGDLKAVWGDLKPDEVKALVAKKDEIESARIKDKGEFDKQLEQRIAAMKTEHDKAIAERDAKITAKDAALNKAVIQTRVLEKASKLGLVEGAAEDLIRRANETWALDDKGEPIAMKDGKPIYGADAAPLAMDAWLDGLTKQAAFLFKPSAGGGAPGGAGGGGGGPGAGKNPFAAGKDFDMTAASLLMKNDPAKARMLADQAGYKLDPGPGNAAAA